MTLSQLLVKITGDDSSLQSTLDKSGKSTQAWGDKVAAIGQMVATSLPFLAIGAGALAASEKMESAFRTIANRTGETGEALKGLEESFKKVYASNAASADQASSALALLHARTGLTGKGLEDLTAQMLKVSKQMGLDASQTIPLVTRVFGDWSISTEKQSKTLAYLQAVSQKTGVDMNKLSESVVYMGAPLRQLGFSFEQAVALIAKFDKEGVNSDLVLGGMKAALNKFAAQGLSAADAFKSYTEEIKKTDSAHAGLIATQLVGQKKASDFVAAVREGRFDLDAMVKSLQSATAAGDKQAAQAPNWHKSWEILKHNIELALIPLGTPLLEALSRAVDGMKPAIGTVTDLAKAFSALPKEAQIGAAGVLGLSLVGPKVVSAITGIAGAITGTLLPALANPYVLAVLGLTAVTAGAFYLVRLNAELDQTFAKFEKWFDGEQKYSSSTEKWLKFSDDQRGKMGALITVTDAATSSIVAAKAATEAFNTAISTLGIVDVAEQIKSERSAFALIEHLFDLGKVSADVYRQALERLTETQHKFNSSIGVLNFGEASKAFNAPLDIQKMFPSDMEKSLAEYAQIKSDLAAAIEEQMNPETAFGKAAMDQFAQVNQGIEGTAGWLDQLAAAANAGSSAFENLSANVKTSFTELQKAFKNLGIQSQSDLDRTANQASVDFETIRDSGVASAKDIERAWLKMTDAQISAGYTLSEEGAAQYEKYKADTENTVRFVKSKWKDLGEQIKSAIANDLARGLADVIMQTRSLGDAFKKLGQDVLDIILNRIIAKGINVLLDALSGVLSKLGGVFGAIGSALGGVTSGAASAGGSAAGAAVSGASSASGAIGSIASTGLSSVMGMVTGAISAVTGVFSIFQNMHQETSLNAIEGNTRRTAITLGEGEDGISNTLKKCWFSLQFQNSAWTTFLGQSYKLFDIHAVLTEMRDLMKAPGGSMALSAAGGGNGPIQVQVLLDGREMLAAQTRILKHNNIRR